MCSRGYCLSNWEWLGLGLGTVNVWSGRLGVERLFTEKKTASLTCYNLKYSEHLMFSCHDVSIAA